MIPTSANLVVDVEAKNIVPNVNFFGWVSRDSGTSWDQVTLSEASKIRNRYLLSGSASFTSDIANATALKWKLTTANQLPVQVHGVSLNGTVVSHSTDAVSDVSGSGITFASQVSMADLPTDQNDLGQGEVWNNSGILSYYWVMPSYAILSMSTMAYKYSWTTESMTSITPIHTGNGSGAVGSTSNGYFVGGWTGGGNIDKYEWATDVAASASFTSVSVSKFDQGSASGPNYGIMAGGYSPHLKVVEKLTFAPEASAWTTSLTQSQTDHGAEGNGDFAIIAGGWFNHTDKFLYSDESVTDLASVLNSGTHTEGIRSSGGPNFGIWAAGRLNGVFVDLTSKFTYATETFASSTNLTTGRRNHVSAGSADAGIFAGGELDASDGGGYTQSVEKYLWSDDTVVATTSLTESGNFYRAPGLSSVQGNF